MVTRECGNRLEWVDWMKAFGIYLVVLGHFYSIGEKFIYVFHVPLFFVISGFLSKKVNDNHLFWKKLWYNLVVPMMIMTIVNFVYACVLQLNNGVFELTTIYWLVRNLIFGMVAGFDSLWFVYTLVLLKAIYQFCRSDKFFYGLTVVTLALAYVYNNSDLSGCQFFLKEPNAIIDICTAYPFFVFGVLMCNYKAMLQVLNNKAKLIVGLLFGILLVILCSMYNGYVGLYDCNYGGNILLFLVGGIAGTVMIWTLSKLLGSTPKIVTVISRGSIIILGLHKILIDLVWAFFTPSVWDTVFAFLILLIFIPSIVAIENYFPLLAGLYRIR